MIAAKHQSFMDFDEISIHTAAALHVHHEAAFALCILFGFFGLSLLACYPRGPSGKKGASDPGYCVRG